MEFRPAVLDSGAALTIDKLGSAVDPTHVLKNGSRTVHAASDRDAGGVTFASASLRMQLLSLDAGLVSPGSVKNMDLYAFPGSTVRASDGVAFSLWNNLWSMSKSATSYVARPVSPVCALSLKFC